MYNKINSYIKDTQKKIEKAVTVEEIDRLCLFHKMKMDEFQVERVAHLIVTMFVGVFFFGVLALALLIKITIVFVLLNVTAIILLVLFFAYIFHYYKLENAVRGTYKLDDELYDKKFDILGVKPYKR